MNAQSRYAALEGDRNNYLERARSSSRFTLPWLIPTSNSPDNKSMDSYPVPWNGIGARGVLNLASRMLLALLPPTQQFFRFSLDQGELTKQGVSPQDISKYEEALSSVERLVLREIEASNDRVVFHEALLHLLVAGNVLLYVGKNGLRAYHLNRYVCSRDSMGNPLEAVICEVLPVYNLPDNAKDLLKEEEEEQLKGILQDDPLPRKDYEKTVHIYTYIEWKKEQVCWHQELKGKIIPGSNGYAPLDANPWLPLRMVRMDGQPYGIGYVEAAALADLQTVEALAQAVAEGALASSKCIFLVRPSGVTKAQDLAKAANGSFVTGDKNDVSALQLEKSQDLQVAMTAKSQIEARLSQAFMLADVRDSERTTAEEVRLQALQIENSLGSIYSVLQIEFQVPYVNRKLDILTRAKKVPPLPKELVKPVMTVGLAAVGRGNDLEQLVRFTTTLGQTLGPEALKEFVNPSELITRLAYSMGIDVLGLVKTQEELQAEQEAAQQAMQQQQLMQSPMTDPQNVANAASTVQDMQIQDQQQSAQLENESEPQY